MFVDFFLANIFYDVSQNLLIREDEIYIYILCIYIQNVLHPLNRFNYIALLAPIDGDICQVYTMSCSCPP